MMQNHSLLQTNSMECYLLKQESGQINNAERFSQPSWELHRHFLSLQHLPHQHQEPHPGK